MFRSAVPPRRVRRALTAVALTTVAVTGLTAAPAGAYVYWSAPSTGTIARANLDGTGVDLAWVTDLLNPLQLALGPNGEYMYFGRAGTPDGPPGAFGRVGLDGTGANDYFAIETDFDQYAQEGFVAANASHLYGSEEYYNPSTPPSMGWAIGEANLDGTGFQDGVHAVSTKLTAVAANNSDLYWANANNTIGRAAVTGGAADQTFMTAVNDVSSLALGVNGEYIYWSSGNGTIGRANLDGTGVENDFIIGADAPHAVAVTAENIYWTNSNGTIGRANLNGSDVEQKWIANAPGAWGLAVNDGPPGVASATPSSLSFGSATAHQNGNSQIVTITNTGHGVLSITGIALTKGDTSDYSLYESTCTTNLQIEPGGSCYFHVLFAPTAAGRRTATITVSSVEQTAPLQITLAGRGSGVIAPKTSISGLKTGRPKLAFTLAAVAGSRDFKTIAVMLPRGLAFANVAANLGALSVTDAARQADLASASGSTNRLTLKLTTATSRVMIAIASPELVIDRAVRKQARSGRRLMLQFRLTVSAGHPPLSHLTIETITGKTLKLP
jgi:virginiamycin B lyase